MENYTEIGNVFHRFNNSILLKKTQKIFKMILE